MAGGDSPGHAGKHEGCSQEATEPGEQAPATRAGESFLHVKTGKDYLRLPQKSTLGSSASCFWFGPRDSQLSTALCRE